MTDGPKRSTSAAGRSARDTHGIGGSCSSSSKAPWLRPAPSTGHVDSHPRGADRRALGAQHALTPGRAQIDTARLPVLLRRIVLGAALLAFGSAAQANDCGPDATFGTNGVANPHTGGWMRVLEIAHDAAGRLLVGVAGGVVLRLDTDGSLDPTWGGDGSVELDISNGNLGAESFALQPDGKLLVASEGLWRLDAAGMPDPSFGVGGTAAGSHSLFDTSLLPDGKILAVGAKLMKFEADGAADATFGAAGEASHSLGLATQLIVQADGRILVIGNAGSLSGDGPIRAARFHPDGSPDASWGNAGESVFPGFWYCGTSTTGDLQSDGKLLLPGCVQDGTGLRTLAVARVDSDGSLDPTFGIGGIVQVPMGGESWGAALVVRADDTILAVGTSIPNPNPWPGDYSAAIASLRSDGAPDYGFDSGALRLKPIGWYDMVGSAVSPTATGEIVVAGVDGVSNLADDVVVVRLRDRICGADDSSCYKARLLPPIEKIDSLPVTDAIESGPVKVLKPLELCPSAATTTTYEVAAPERRYVAYKIKPSTGEPKHVRQFGIEVTDRFGTWLLDTIKPDRLLVAGHADPTTPPSPYLHDDLKCYRVRPGAGAEKLPKGTLVWAKDAFELRQFELRRVSRLCLAADAGKAPEYPSRNLLCYGVRRAPGAPAHTKQVTDVRDTLDQYVALTKKVGSICFDATVSLP